MCKLPTWGEMPGEGQADGMYQLRTTGWKEGKEMIGKEKALPQVPPRRQGKSPSVKVLFVSITRLKGVRKYHSLTQGEDDD